jgi:regulator of replication initiation timing
MNQPDDMAARLTIRLAGVLQEIHNSWSSRVNAYFSRLESLVDGKWLDSDDIMGILSESKLAAAEALDGLGNDLSSEILHESSGLFSRFEEERVSLVRKISDLEDEINDMLNADGESLQQENRSLRHALSKFKEFTILKAVQKLGKTSYGDLSKETGIKKGKLRKYVKWLHEQGFIFVNKKTRPHQLVFLSAPWRSAESVPFQARTTMAGSGLPIDSYQS